MILNGLSVAASLMKRGEDSLLGQTEMATAFQLNKRDLVAAREKTGCYSLTRYHLNEAAELLGIKPTDFVYRITPNMLKADGGSTTVSGAQAGELGATGLDAMTKYRADVAASTDTDAMVLDLAGAAQGGDFAPEDVTNRFKVLKEIADGQNGSLVAAMLSILGTSRFVRYNASAINKTIFESLNDPDGTQTENRQTAAAAHLIFAIFGAYSTGAALSILRQFLSTGIVFDYDEMDMLRNWTYLASGAMLGTSIRIKTGTERPNAKLDKLFDAAYNGSGIWTTSPYFDSVKGEDQWNRRGRFGAIALQNEMKKFLEEFAEAFRAKAVSQGSQLDVDGLVTRTNKLLKSTPQLMSRQA